MEMAELTALKKESPSCLKLSEAWCTSFLTLTYTDEYVPRSLDKEALRKFLKRLNKHTSSPIRYFGCGEYGSKTGRPHYHAIVFGLHFRSEAVQKSWIFGRTQVRPVTLARARYVAKYTLKKNSDRNGSRCRTPEFSLKSKGSSKNPNALGSRYLSRVAQSLSFSKLSVIPYYIRIQGKKWPLDRYARNYLSQLLGVPLADPEMGTLLAPVRLLRDPEAEGRRFQANLRSERQYRRMLANSRF